MRFIIRVAVTAGTFFVCVFLASLVSPLIMKLFVVFLVANIAGYIEGVVHTLQDVLGEHKS